MNAPGFEGLAPSGDTAPVGSSIRKVMVALGLPGFSPWTDRIWKTGFLNRAASAVAVPGAAKAGSGVDAVARLHSFSSCPHCRC
jgi:hypothetical protein